MNNQIKKFLAALGLTAIALTGANGAIINTTTNSTGASGYALDIRFNGTQQWVFNNVFGQVRYGNNNFTSDGNLLVGIDDGRILEVNASNGNLINSRTGLAAGQTYSFAQSGGYLFAPTGTGELSRWTTSQDFSTDSPATITDDVRRSIYADPTGNKLFASSSDQTSVVRYSVDGSGNISEDWTTSIGGQVRGMTFVDGRGLYVANSGYNPDRLYFLNDSGTATQVTGLPTMNTLFEAVSYANIDGFDYLFMNGNLPLSTGLENGLLIARLGSNTAIDAWDFYSGSTTDWIGNQGVLASWATGGATSGTVFWGDGAQIRAFEITVIPEPSTYAMLALGMAMSAYGLRVSRRKKQVAQKA